jgi:hypothetical protein
VRRTSVLVQFFGGNHLRDLEGPLCGLRGEERYMIVGPRKYFVGEGDSSRFLVRFGVR